MLKSQEEKKRRGEGGATDRRQRREKKESGKGKGMVHSYFQLLFHLSLLCFVLVSPLSTFLKNNWKDEKDRRATEDANKTR